MQGEHPIDEPVDRRHIEAARAFSPGPWRRVPERSEDGETSRRFRRLGRGAVRRDRGLRSAWLLRSPSRASSRRSCLGAAARSGGLYCGAGSAGARRLFAVWLLAHSLFNRQSGSPIRRKSAYTPLYYLFVSAGLRLAAVLRYRRCCRILLVLSAAREDGRMAGVGRSLRLSSSRRSGKWSPEVTRQRLHATYFAN